MVSGALSPHLAKWPVALWRLIAAAASGVVIGLLLVLLFGLLSGFALSPERLVHVAGTALERGELPHTTRTNEDFFTECATLEMQYLRPPSLLLNVFDTRLIFPEDGAHPCEVLRQMVKAGPRAATFLDRARSYPNYPYGSRHLEAFVLSVLGFETARTFYLWTSYLSVFALAWAAWRNAKRSSLVFVPVFILLGFAFSLHLYGNNLIHAPGFIFGFFALSLFLAAKERLSAFRARLFFFGCLGVVVAYFDMLAGAIPVILSLSIVLNHFFYVDRRVPPGASIWARGAFELVAITLCFVSAYAALALLRLGILEALNVDWHPFFRDMAAKFGSARAGDVVGLTDNLSRLWDHRWQLTPGGVGPATWLMILSASSWIFALGALPVLWLFAREEARATTVNLLVLMIGTLGIMAWYDCFPAHTYQHVLFIVRTVTLPIAYGITAAIVVVMVAYRGNRYFRGVCAAMFFLSTLATIGLLNGPWRLETASMIHSARFVVAPADRAGCSPKGLSPDGIPDGVVEIVYQPARLPWSFLRKHVPRPVYIRLERSNPAGAYETGPTVYVLGIAISPNGDLLNAQDGSFTPPESKRVRLFAHFCRDGYDSPDSEYRINVDGATVPVAP